MNLLMQRFATGCNGAMYWPLAGAEEVSSVNVGGRSRKMARNRGLLLGIIVMLSALSSPAKADRASLMSYVFRACQNQLLNNAQFVALLALSRTTVDEVCQCQAPLFISRLTDADVTELSAGGEFTQNGWDRLFEGAKFCALTLRRSR
jgi:hypothetical protein